MTTATIALILPLADAQKSRRTGAKATNLSRLVAAHFAVPRGFVLSADAYRSHLWASGARGIASAEADAEQREAIREAILSNPIPEDVWRLVAESYERLSWQTGIPEPKAAVRSSALEDSPHASFPGAYESYLNVSGLDALSIAIKRVWASLWSGKAAAYRVRHGCSTEPAMAVIVQQMVEADLSGMASTANPVTGDPLALSVLARIGGGESAQYEVSLRDLSVASRSPESVVEEATVRLIAEQSILIEDAIGGRIEVEWVVDRDGIWILQAGPVPDVPVYFPVDWGDQADGQVLWTRDDPRPVSYLSRSLVTSSPRQRIINGYLYTRGEAAVESSHKRETQRAREKAVDEAADSLKEWQKRVGPDGCDRLRGVAGLDPGSQDSPHLLRTLELVTDVARVSYEWMRRAERVVPMVSELLCELLEDRTLVWRLIGGVADAVFERDALLQELAGRFAIAEGSGKLDDEKWWRAYKADVERFAGLYGYGFIDPGEAADPARWRSWIEDTDSVFRVIGAISKRDDETTLVTRHCAAEQDSQAAEAATLATMKGAARAEAKRLIELARGWVHTRTQAERDRALACSWLRVLVKELGSRLENAGTISCGDDVFLLSVDEIAEIPAKPNEAEQAELARKIASRKHEVWLESRLTPPQRLPINDVETQHVASLENGIAGVAASAGIVTGRARIVATVEDAAEIEQGDIIIVDTSSSAWTPLFTVAGGFVCEAGNDASPEAIAARAYGIPAIMACAGAVGAIRDRQRITVDGAAGLVSL